MKQLFLATMAFATMLALPLGTSWDKQMLRAERVGSGTVLQARGLGAPATGPLRVSPLNPRYFTDASGKAILLAGAQTWYTRQDGGFSDPPPVFDYSTYLNSLVQNNNDFFRMFVWEQAKWNPHVDGDYFYAPSAYARTGPGTALDGKPKFNLTQLNQAYFDRLRQRASQAGQLGIYVAVQLFDGFSVTDKGKGNSNPWDGHPFNSNNNINGIDGDTNHDNQGDETQTYLPASPNPALPFQEAYVKKVVDTVNDLDNVLYEISNESDSNSQDWQYYLINLVHAYEAAKPKQHPVGMTVEYPGGNNAELFASTAEWISLNADGGYYDNPPPADGSKVILNDTDHLSFPRGNRGWMWKSFTRGMNLAFMDSYDCQAGDARPNCDPNDPSWVSLRKNLGYAVTYAGKMNLMAMTPHGELASSGYALANPTASGAEYLVYLHGWVTVDLSAASGSLSVEWFNPGDGTTTPGGSVSGGATRSFSAPFAGDAVLYLKDAASTPTPTPPGMTAGPPA